MVPVEACERSLPTLPWMAIIAISASRAWLDPTFPGAAGMRPMLAVYVTALPGKVSDASQAMVDWPIWVGASRHRRSTRSRRRQSDGTDCSRMMLILRDSVTGRLTMIGAASVNWAPIGGTP